MQIAALSFEDDSKIVDVNFISSIHLFIYTYAVAWEVTGLQTAQSHISTLPPSLLYGP